ncbi:MFS transporter [Streptomyces sparsogenes]|uniref:MFS transporter n=1 Tax=Streptomyces sparsogenes TaxID=67365 RepID=UPI0033C1F5CE
MTKAPGLPDGPMRSLYAATLVLAVGRGGWYSCLAVFATRSLGLTPARFGVCLTAAGVVALVAGGFIGFAADRIGPRRMLIGLVLVQGLASVAYAVARQPWAFALVSCFALTAERTVPAVRIALVAGLTSGETRLRRLASLRVAGSGGTAVGAALGAGVLYLDREPAYVALLGLYGVAAVASAATLRGVPSVPGLTEEAAGRRALVVRDRPFLLITLLSGVLALNWGMLGSGVPLWIAGRTGAPVWAIGVIMVLNTVAIVLFQGRASRGSATVAGAARAAAWCSVPLALSCVLFAATYHRSGPSAVALLLAATVVHAVGELLFVAGSWGLAVGLTPQEAHGEYQGVFNSGSALAVVLSPALMTALLIGWGVGGWLVLAGLFLAGGLPLVPVCRWAARHPARTGGQSGAGGRTGAAAA